MNQRGNRTPPSAASATVITIGSVIRPRKALGNPSRFACQVDPTVVHEIFELMSQDSTTSGFSAIAIASMDSTREATSPRIEDTSISM